uniref:Uncharacterized protein n=1 Tax=Helianthus annuus TaxID=4232 RepID=A0A251TWU2_HELAN
MEQKHNYRKHNYRRRSSSVVSPQAWFVHGLLAFRTSQRRRSGCLSSSPRLLPACSHIPDRL